VEQFLEQRRSGVRLVVAYSQEPSLLAYPSQEPSLLAYSLALATPSKNLLEIIIISNYNITIQNDAKEDQNEIIDHTKHS
jgi:hypothetical protein